MRFFYDTEFLENGSTIELISIAIVAESGAEYYAVNADMPVDAVREDAWLRENVWRHLPVRGMKRNLTSVGGGKHGVRVTTPGVLNSSSVLVRPAWVIRNEVRDFLLNEGTGRREDTELWADFAAYDHVALCQLFGRMIALPNHIPMWTHDLQQLAAAHPDVALPEQEDDLHDALADARHVFAQWRALTGEGAQ